jgi:hypothetical protein
MAKKQTRRSISVSRVTYERLKAFCESNNISMSQFVETRVGDFLGEGEEGAATAAAVASIARPAPHLGAGHGNGHAVPGNGHGHGNGHGSMTGLPGAIAPRPTLAAVGTSPTRPGAMSGSMSSGSMSSGSMSSGAPRQPQALTSAAARFVVEPPPPIIKPRADAPAPPPVVRSADQIFTF